MDAILYKAPTPEFSLSVRVQITGNQLLHFKFNSVPKNTRLNKVNYFESVQGITGLIFQLHSGVLVLLLDQKFLKGFGIIQY